MTLETFAAPPTAAELLGVLLAGEQGWGAAAMSRLNSAFLHDDGSRPHLRDCALLIPGLSAEPWPPGGIEIARRLEDAWPSLRSELAHAARVADYSPYRQDNDAFLDPVHWSTAHVTFLGRRHANADLLPRTLAVIEAAGGAAEIVSLSRIAPGGRIRPHCGPWNTRLTVHLGVQTPEGCDLRVGDEWRTWSPGRCLVFDDSFEHEVIHNGRENRIVLLIDVWRPDLTRPERAVLEDMLAILQREYWTARGEGVHEPSSSDGGSHVVIRDPEARLALWEAGCSVPAGWTQVLAARSRSACLKWVGDESGDSRAAPAEGNRNGST